MIPSVVEILGQLPPNSSAGLDALRVEANLRRGIPYASYQYIDVTFNSTEDVDTDIKHNLNPTDPYDVDYEVVRWKFSAAPTAAPVVYEDTSASRRAWGLNYIVLRCNEASVEATLRLSIRRT